MSSKLAAGSGASRRFISLPLAFALGACATYYDEPPPQQAAMAGAAGESGTAGKGGGAAGTGTLGGSGGGGAGNAAGTAAGGTLGGNGGGQGGVAGAAAGMGGNAGVAGGGAGGGGAGETTAGAGGKASGGSGGMAGNGGSGGSGGNGGSGGAATAPCSTHPLTAKSKWVVTASISEGNSPPAKAVDSDLSTRWTTGKDQMGGEWLQIDFGATVSLTQVTLALGSSTNDYPRKYATRFSNSSQNTAAPVLASGMGASGTDTVMNFPKGSSGRYVLISQSGTATGLWWSVAEIFAACSD